MRPNTKTSFLLAAPLLLMDEETKIAYANKAAKLAIGNQCFAMPNPRIMEGYTPGVDDDPSSYLEEAAMLAAMMAQDSRPPLDITPDDSTNDNSDEHDHVAEVSSVTEEPAYFRQQQQPSPPSMEAPVAARDVPPLLAPPREIITTMPLPIQSRRTRPSPREESSRNTTRRQCSQPPTPHDKSCNLWAVLVSLLLVLVLLVVIAAMVLVWAFL